MGGAGDGKHTKNTATLRRIVCVVFCSGINSLTYTVTVFKFAAILFRVFVIWSISRLFMFAFREIREHK